MESALVSDSCSGTVTQRTPIKVISVQNQKVYLAHEFDTHDKMAQYIIIFLFAQSDDKSNYNKLTSSSSSSSYTNLNTKA